MKIDDIFALWDVDSKIDRQELGDEALKISLLHNKYYKIFINEKLALKKYESEFKQLKLEKFEFYTQGPTPEQIDKGWKLPSIGRIVRGDVDKYLEADKDIIHLTLKIAVQNEKIDLLESIIRTLRDRNFNIRAAIDWSKFQVGA